LLAAVVVEVEVSKQVQVVAVLAGLEQVRLLQLRPGFLTQLLLAVVGLAVLVLLVLTAVILFFLPLHLTAAATAVAVIVQTAQQ
jgi:hypothetical protein